jgi:hypothetical protein
MDRYIYVVLGTDVAKKNRKHHKILIKTTSSITDSIWAIIKWNSDLRCKQCVCVEYEFLTSAVMEEFSLTGYNAV